MKNFKRDRGNTFKFDNRKGFWLPKKLYKSPSAAKIFFHLNSGHLEEKALSWQIEGWRYHLAPWDENKYFSPSLEKRSSLTKSAHMNQLFKHSLKSENKIFYLIPTHKIFC